jgi:hypothetical protein
MLSQMQMQMLVQMLVQMQMLVRQVHNALTEPWDKEMVARNRVGFVASLADRASCGGELRADCGRGHRPGPGSSVPGRRHHHAVLILCR